MEHRMDYGFTCSGGECDILFVTLMSGVPLDLFISQKNLSSESRSSLTHTANSSAQKLPVNPSEDPTAVWNMLQDTKLVWLGAIPLDFRCLSVRCGRKK